MNKIFNNDDDRQENHEQEKQRGKAEKPNIYKGRTDSAESNAKYPAWDIVPPNQIINPRIKQQ